MLKVCLCSVDILARFASKSSLVAGIHLNFQWTSSLLIVDNVKLVYSPTSVFLFAIDFPLVEKVVLVLLLLLLCYELGFSCVFWFLPGLDGGYDPGQKSDQLRK